MQDVSTAYCDADWWLLISRDATVQSSQFGRVCRSGSVLDLSGWISVHKKPPRPHPNHGKYWINMSAKQKYQTRKTKEHDIILKLNNRI